LCFLAPSKVAATSAGGERKRKGGRADGCVAAAEWATSATSEREGESG
jgi:hypothetical protein